MKKLIVLLTVTLVVVLFASTSAIDLKGKFGLTGQGGLAIPFGDFSSKDVEKGYAAKLGFGFGAGAEYFVANNISVGGTFRYDIHGVKEENGEDVGDAKYKITNFGVFFKYLFPLESKIVPYARLDVGLYKLKSTYSVESVSASISFDSKFGAAAGGGVMYEVNKNVLLGGEVLFHNAMVKDAKAKFEGEELKLESNIQYLSIFAGVTVLVGGTK